MSGGGGYVCNITCAVQTLPVKHKTRHSVDKVYVSFFKPMKQINLTSEQNILTMLMTRKKATYGLTLVLLSTTRYNKFS